MISVVVPAFNAERWLDGCLESIFSQNIEGLEVIVVDDGSTDSTPAVAAARGAKVITIANGGQANARNVGLGHVSQPFTVFVDADDALLPGALRLLLDVQKRTGADVVCGGAVEGTEPVAEVARGAAEASVLNGREAVLTQLYQECDILSSVWAKLFRTDVVRSHRFEPGLYYEDMDYMFRLFSGKIADSGFRVAMTSAPVYFYRQHDGSFIHVFSEKRLDVLKVTERMEREAEKLDPEVLEAARSRRLSACFNMYVLLRRNCLFPDVRVKCRDEIVRLRGRMLRNRRVRLKNKLGIAASYLLGAVGLFR